MAKPTKTHTIKVSPSGDGKYVGECPDCGALREAKGQDRAAGIVWGHMVGLHGKKYNAFDKIRVQVQK